MKDKPKEKEQKKQNENPTQEGFSETIDQLTDCISDLMELCERYHDISHRYQRHVVALRAVLDAIEKELLADNEEQIDKNKIRVIFDTLLTESEDHK